MSEPVSLLIFQNICLYFRWHFFDWWTLAHVYSILPTTNSNVCVCVHIYICVLESIRVCDTSACWWAFRMCASLQQHDSNWRLCNGKACVCVVCVYVYCAYFDNVFAQPNWYCAPWCVVTWLLLLNIELLCSVVSNDEQRWRKHRISFAGIRSEKSHLFLSVQASWQNASDCTLFNPFVCDVFSVHVCYLLSCQFLYPNFIIMQFAFCDTLPFSHDFCKCNATTIVVTAENTIFFRARATERARERERKTICKSNGNFSHNGGIFYNNT